MLLLLLFMWMFWYAMHLKLFWAFLWCMWVEVQVLSLFKTVASNHKTITYITLLKVVLLYEGSSCITLQHLLICTKKHIWKFKNPCFFPICQDCLLYCQPGCDHQYEESDDCKGLTIPHASISTTRVSTNKNKVMAVFSL